MPRKMRAALFATYGGPEVVEMGKVPIPQPGPGEVRIKIEAAAMNHLDLWVRRGLPIETPMPHIGGSDMAGGRLCWHRRGGGTDRDARRR